MPKSNEKQIKLEAERTVLIYLNTDFVALLVKMRDVHTVFETMLGRHNMRLINTERLTAELQQV